MSYSEFIQTTVIDLNATLYKELRDTLIDEYLPVFLVQKEDLSSTVLAEKLCDYFEKIELKTSRTFDKTVEKYMKDLDSIVCDRIAKELKPKNNKTTPATSRARKYYEKACEFRRLNEDSVRVLIDYTRIMLCLYMAIINGDKKEINDFRYSMSELNLTKIIESLYKEKGALLWQKTRFEIKDPYTSDRSTFIMLVIIFYYMKSKEIVGEY